MSRFTVADGEYTTPQGRVVVVSTSDTYGSSIPTKSIYNKSNNVDVCYYLDIERFQDKLQEVFNFLMNDCDSLGYPVKTRKKRIKPLLDEEPSEEEPEEEENKSP